MVRPLTFWAKKAPDHLPVVAYTTDDRKLTNARLTYASSYTTDQPSTVDRRPYAKGPPFARRTNAEGTSRPNSLRTVGLKAPSDPTLAGASPPLARWRSKQSPDVLTNVQSGQGLVSRLVASVVSPDQCFP